MLPKFSVKKPLTIVVAIIVIVIIGIVAYMSLGVDLLPDMELPYMIIVTIYAGAEPDIVENEITIPLEESFATVSNVKRMTSTSNEHYSMIVLELESGVDISNVKSNLNDAIALTSLPDSDMLNDPMIIEIDPSMLPIMSLSVSYEADSNEQVNAYLEQVVKKINSVNGVASVSESGLISKFAYLNSNSTKTAEYLLDTLEEKFDVEIGVSQERKENLRIELKELIENAENDDSLKTNGEIDAKKVLDRLLEETSDANDDFADEGEQEEAIAQFLNDYLLSELKKDGVARSAAINFINNALENSYIVEDGEENKKIFYNLVDDLSSTAMVDFVESYLGSMLGILTEDIYQQVIFAQDFDMPAGSVTEGATSIVVKVGDNIENREDFLNLPIFTVDVAEQLQTYIERIELILNIMAATTEDGKLVITDEQLKAIAENIAYQAETPDDYAEWAVDTITSENVSSPYYMSNSAKNEWINQLNSQYLLDGITENPFYTLVQSWNDDIPVEWRSTLLKTIDDNGLYLQNGTVISEQLLWNDDYSSFYLDRLLELRDSAISDKPMNGNYDAYVDFVIDQVAFLNDDNRTIWETYLLESTDFKDKVDEISLSNTLDWQLGILDIVISNDLYPSTWSTPIKNSVEANLSLSKENLLLTKPTDSIGYASLAVYNVAIVSQTMDYYLSQDIRNIWINKISSDTSFISFIDTIGANDDYMYMVYDYLYNDAKSYVEAENKDSISTLLPINEVIRAERAWDNNVKESFSDRISTEVYRYQNIEESQKEMIESIGENEYSNFIKFFGNRTIDENYELLLNILDVIGEFGGEGAVVVSKNELDETIYIIDIEKISLALENSGEDMKITLKLGSLCDVSFIDDMSKQVTKLILSGESGIDVKDSIQLSIDKEPTASSAEVTEGINNALEELKEQDSKFSYTVLSDDGLIINFMLESVFSSLIIGGFLAILILIFFLKDIKATLVIGSSIIISVLTALILMYFTDISLNVISLGGLTLGIGMLVDNSIVVLENTYRIKSKGYSVMQSAVQGASQMLPAIFASTLTTIVVFVPVLFIEGLVKEIFLDFALTIVYSLGASLIVSMTLVPMAYNSFMNTSERESKFAFRRKLKESKFYKAVNSGGVLKEGKISIAIKKGYIKTLNWCLKYKFVPIIIVVVLLGVSIFGAFSLGTEYFPNSYMGYISVNVNIDTKKIDEINLGIDYLDEDFYTYEDAEQDVVDILTNVFSSYSDINAVGISRATGMNIGGMNLGSGAITATLTLIDEKDRELTAQEMVDALKEKLEKESNGLFSSSVSMYSLSSLISMTTGEMGVRIYGDNYSDMQNEAKRLAEMYREIEGVISVDDGINQADKEYKIIIDKNKANLYGLTVAQVYLQISDALTAPTSLHNLKLSGKADDANEDLTVYLYDDDYNSKYWYLAKDGAGKEHKVYFKNNDVDNTQGSFGEYYLKNNTGNSMYVKYLNGSEEKIELIQDGAYIPLNRVGDDLTYSYAIVTEQTEGNHTISYQSVQLKMDSSIKYYSNLKSDIDLITLNISSENLLDPNAEKESVQLYKLLSEACFLTDNNGKVMYRAGGDNQIPVGIQLVDGYSSINHTERQKVVDLTIYYDDSINSNVIQQRVDEITELYNATKPSVITVSTTASDGIMDGVFEDLIMVLGVAILLIFLVMVAQFQSWKSPFIIMGTIVLAFTGSFLFMWMTGTKISIMSLIGLIILMGVVVNNGIVFVDYANNLIEKGYSKRNALLKTGADRLRPIIMTAITTILGMLGMALDGSDYGSLLQPLAITSIGGMVYATLMTLLVVPILYEILNRNTDKRARKASLFRSTQLEFKEDEFDMDETEIDLFIKEVSLNDSKKVTQKEGGVVEEFVSNGEDIVEGLNEDEKPKEKVKFKDRIKNIANKLKKQNKDLQ